MQGRHERDLVDGITSVEVLPLKDHERCLIYRRRAGWKQSDVAHDLCVSRWWLNRMERGEVDCSDLLWYWEQ